MKIIPRLTIHLFIFTVLCAVIGALVASIYGILHDQLTYTLSPEYYTNFKFYQFGYVASDAPARKLVFKIGVSASWWVGLIAGWLLGRAAYRVNSLKRSIKRYLWGITSLVASSVLIAALLAGYFHYFGNKNDTDIQNYFGLEASELEAFLLVGNIHNGSYLGSILGLLATLTVLIWQNQREKQTVKIQA